MGDEDGGDPVTWDGGVTWDQGVTWDDSLLTLEDWQFSYNGLTFGVGTEVQLVTATGIRALPSVAHGDVQRPRDQGMLVGLDLNSARTVTLDLAVEGESAADLDAQITALETAFQTQSLTLLPLQYQLPGEGNRVIYCRPEKRSVPLNFNYSSAFYATMSVQLVAVDPRIYDAAGQAVAVGLPEPVTGMTFPATFPLTFGSGGGGGGSIVAVNAGNYETRPTLTITGPCTNPRVENETSGEFIAFGYTLLAGETLVIDMDAHTALLDGTASLYYTVVPGSQFWVLEPGTSTVSFFSSDPAPTGATLTMSWASAWL